MRSCISETPRKVTKAGTLSNSIGFTPLIPFHKGVGLPGLGWNKFVGKIKGQLN